MHDFENPSTLSRVIGIQSDSDFCFLPYLPQFKMADENVTWRIQLKRKERTSPNKTSAEKSFPFITDSTANFCSYFKTVTFGKLPTLDLARAMFCRGSDDQSALTILTFGD